MKNQAGFTLMETVVVAGIAVIVGVLLVGILVNNTGVANLEKSIVTQGLNTNDSLHEIENSIRQAAMVVNGYPDISPTYITGNSTLVIKIPSINNDGVIGNVFDFIVITKDSSQANLLIKYIFPDEMSTREPSEKMLSNILETIEFAYLDKNDNIVSPTSTAKIKTTITVLPQNGSAGKSRSATIVTSLRN